MSVDTSPQEQTSFVNQLLPEVQYVHQSTNEVTAQMDQYVSILSEMESQMIQVQNQYITQEGFYKEKIHKLETQIGTLQDSNNNLVREGELKKDKHERNVQEVQEKLNTVLEDNQEVLEREKGYLKRMQEMEELSREKDERIKQLERQLKEREGDIQDQGNMKRLEIEKIEKIEEDNRKNVKLLVDQYEKNRRVSDSMSYHSRLRSRTYFVKSSLSPRYLSKRYVVSNIPEGEEMNNFELASEHHVKKVKLLEESTSQQKKRIFQLNGKVKQLEKDLKSVSDERELLENTVQSQKRRTQRSGSFVKRMKEQFEREQEKKQKEYELQFQYLEKKHQDESKKLKKKIELLDVKYSSYKKKMDDQLNNQHEVVQNLTTKVSTLQKQKSEIYRELRQLKSIEEKREMRRRKSSVDLYKHNKS